MTNQKNSGGNIFKKALILLGPGLFLIGYNIGTGSVTTMASAGSRWGMSLAWTVLLSCVFTFIGVMAFSRYTLVTGDTILSGIRKNFPIGKQISLFIMGAIILAEFAGITGLMSIIVALLHEWIRSMLGYYMWGIKFGLTVSFSVILFAILWTGSYENLEKILAVLVAIIGLAFVATTFLVFPPWKEIFMGLVPQVPKEPDAALIVAGMAGTTFGSAILYCRSITLKAKGWGISQARQSRIDATTSVVVMFILSIAVMICAAGTLHVIGMPVVNAVDMIKTLEPLVGRFANSLFTFGIVAAGLSSLIPTILIGPWLISDYSDSHINPKSKSSRTLVTIGIIVGLIGPYVRTNPVFLMIITMALLAIILPLSTVAITVLLNQKQMGKYKNTPLMNIAMTAMIIFSIIMAYYGVIGLLEYF